MGPIVKWWYLRVPSEAFISIPKLLTSLLTQSPNWLAQVSVGFSSIEVQCLRAVIGQHPREDRILVQVIARPPSQCVQLQCQRQSVYDNTTACTLARAYYASKHSLSDTTQHSTAHADTAQHSRCNTADTTQHSTMQHPRRLNRLA